MNKEVKYKLWISIEKITTTDDDETYEDLKNEETRNVGTFSSIEEAYEQMNLLGDTHQNIESEKDYSNSYSSIHDFISRNNLEMTASYFFGENWEAENDIEQIQELLNSIEDGYIVKHIDVNTNRDKRADNYIKVSKSK